MSRPRPVEIAVAFDDGTAISTLVNPQRDLADSHAAYGITVQDVLLAPTLAEAWTVFGPILEGCTPVGVFTDRTLGLIEFELKRLGRVIPLPLGIDLPPEKLNSAENSQIAGRTALERAQATLDARMRLALHDANATAFELQEGHEPEPTYLLTRDPEANAPQSIHIPVLGSILHISRQISAALLRGWKASEIRSRIPSHDPLAPKSDVHSIIVNRIMETTARASQVPPELVDRLSEVGTLVDIDTDGLLAEFVNTPVTMEDVLVSGARVCFTGTALTSTGQKMDRHDIEALASKRGLVPVSNVTKTKCDALIVAEIGTQSGKARKAAEYGKPVFSVKQFLTWLE